MSARPIGRVMPGVNIVGSAREAAKVMAKVRKDAKPGGGTTEFYVSDEPCGFETVASIFLETEIGRDVRRISIEDF